MATTTKSQKINPKEWRVIGQLRHKGVTYGTDEPLPSMTVEEAEGYVVAGTLLRRGADTRAEEYLDAPDGMILQRILDENPAAKLLENMLELALRHSRSKVLELSLRIAIRGAHAAHPAR